MGDWKKVVEVFAEIGFAFDVTEFEDRLVAQKIVCLLELSGVPLGYPFNLYIRGPYSPTLAEDYFHMATGGADRGGVFLSAEEKEAVHRIDTLFRKSPSLLEIGATYGFLLRARNLSPTAAERIVRQEKGFYPGASIAKGISRAKQLLVTPTEDDLRWLKEEVEPWQRAATRSMRE